MDCDYCGQPALWEVTTGTWPGDGMTRYVCQRHVDAAREHCRQVGDTNVYELNDKPGRAAA